MSHTRQVASVSRGNARNANRVLLALWVLLCLCATEILEAKVYKWTDANGKVHYGERPPPGTDAKNIRVPAQDNLPAPGAVSDAERRARQRQLLKAFEDDRKERAAGKAKTQKQEAKLKRACTRMKKYIDQEPAAKYLYRKDKKTGAKVVVSDAERASHMSKIRAQYKKNC